MSEHDVPGVAIALTSGDSVEWTAGFGVTGPTGAPVTPETVFQVASLSKPVFAHLVGKVQARSDWALTDRIADWARPDDVPPEWLELSADALLSHTSGLRFDAQLDRVVVDPTARGTWSYSGPGYVLLQRALETAHGTGLEHMAASEIFEPWGLGSMTFVEPDTGDVATGHDRSGTPLDDLAWSGPNAASSLHSNALDYARFVARVADFEDGSDMPWSRLIRRRAEVRTDLGLYWGAGWALEGDGHGSVTAFHWGSNPGFKSFALFDAGRDKGLVILTNGDNGLELVEEIVAILDDRPHPLFEFYMLHPDD